MNAALARAAFATEATARPRPSPLPSSRGTPRCALATGRRAASAATASSDGTSLPHPDQLRDLLGVPEVDCGVDCVGYEGHGEGEYSSSERPETVLNDLFTVVRAGGAIGIPGIYVGADSAAASEPAKKGIFPLGFGGAWGKSLRITTGMAPVLNYGRELMTAILWGRIDLRAIMNFEVLPLPEANRAYQRFSDGEPKKFVFDPHGILAKAGVSAAA